MKRNRKKNETDIVDFLFDNIGPFLKNLKYMFYYIKEAWITVPDLFIEILTQMHIIVNKIMLRVKSYLILSITQDIGHIDTYKVLWNHLITLDNNYDLDDYFKNLKHNKSRKNKDCLDLMYEYIRNGRKDDFLNYCLTQKDNSFFIMLRVKLLDLNKNNLEVSSDIFEKPKKQTKTITVVHAHNMIRNKLIN